MTSSIYPQPVSINFVGSVVSLTITTGGSGYTTTPGITIDSPSGNTAAAISSIDRGRVSSITIDTILNQGTGYVSPPNVTIAAPVSGTQATGTANLSNGQVISITITNAGSGYLSAPIVAIDAPSVNAVPAEGTVTTSDGVIATISVIGGTNSGYTDGESIILSSNLSGTGATATAIISGGVIQSVTITDGGSGFVGTEIVTITGVSSGTATATFTVTTVNDDVITSVTITVPGSGYTSVPTVLATGGGNGAIIVATISSISSGDILSSDIAITNELVSPGGGGILRLYFAFVFDVTPGDITVTNNGIDKGTLNADNDSQIISNAYYRFDLDVESGDNINLELKGTAGATNIASTNFLRAHLVQFGA